MISNMTEKQRADEFRAAARWISDISRGLNTSSSEFMMRYSFETEFEDEAEKAIKGLEKLIAHREYEILQALEAIEDYKAALANGGQAALTQIRAEAWAEFRSKQQG